jgi:hypothetical protein
MSLSGTKRQTMCGNKMSPFGARAEVTDAHPKQRDDPTPKSGMHRNNQDMMVYSLSLAPLASFIAGGAGTRPEHSIGGYGAQFRFYSPAETR